MSGYPNLIDEPELLKIRTKDGEIKDLKYETEKHDYGNLLKSPKIDNEYYKKKYKSLNKKIIFKIVSEILKGVGGISVASGLTISGLAPAGMVAASGISFLTSISTLITNEFFSKFKILHTKLRSWIIVTTLLFDKTLKESMIDKRIDEKEGGKLISTYDHYINKQDENRKWTQFKVEKVFGKIIQKDTNSPEQITKPNNFLAKYIYIYIKIGSNLFKPKKKNNNNIEPSAPLEYNFK